MVIEGAFGCPTLSFLRYLSLARWRLMSLLDGSTSLCSFSLFDGLRRRQIPTVT